jgi:hypothetical protein
MLGMTCLVGRHELAGWDCLAEYLVLHTGGGAVAVFSPTGLSINSLAKVLDEEFLKGTFAVGETLIGEVVLRAEDGYADHDLPVYMLYIYNLLGDPTLLMK